MSALRERIVECMRRHPVLSQADIARACGIKTPSVSNWLDGSTKTLKAETARLAAQLFGCDQNWLATGVGSPGWLDAAAPTPAAPVAPPTVAAALPVVLEALARAPEVSRPALAATLRALLDGSASAQQTAAVVELLLTAATVESAQLRPAPHKG